jgi:hypothetical protein
MEISMLEREKNWQHDNLELRQMLGADKMLRHKEKEKKSWA